MTSADSPRGRPARTPDQPRLRTVLVRAIAVAFLAIGAVFLGFWWLLSELGTPFGLAPVLLIWAGLLITGAALLAAWHSRAGEDR